MGRRRKRPSAHHGVLVVDKTIGCTSHDVVQWTRRVLGTSQVGHAGTLDPMATGVLVVAVGMATRLVPFLTADDKRYVATLRLGTATHSLDADGEITDTRPVPPLTQEDVTRAARAFVGAQKQRAPAVSAIKVEGRALHERVRRGEEVVAPVRDVVCHSLDIGAVRAVEGLPSEQALDVDLELHAAKGYYVRSLGRDLAEALGTVGHLVALRRVASGAFTLEGALPGEILAGEHDEACRQATRAALRDMVDATRSLGHLAITDEEVRELGFGRTIDGGASDDMPPGALRAAISPSGRVVAIVERNEDRWAVRRGFPIPADAAAAEGES